MPINLRALLEEMIDKDASDLHLVAGERPKLRVDGDITNASSEEVMTPKDTLSLAYSVLTEPEEALRDGKRARLLVRHSEPGPLPRQRLQAARLRVGRHPADSLHREDVR